MRLPLALSVAVLLAFPAGAAAMIQVDQGIAGARLDNTQAQVKAALGQPAHEQTGTNDFGPFRRFVYSGGIRVLFQGDDKVTSVSTSGLGDRTSKGVGVGSTEKSVKSKVPGVKCETIAGTRSCHTNDFTPGERVTDFLLKNGKVTRVTVGFVID
jgi:hypothetical protein